MFRAFAPRRSTLTYSSFIEAPQFSLPAMITWSTENIKGPFVVFHIFCLWKKWTKRRVSKPFLSINYAAMLFAKAELYLVQGSKWRVMITLHRPDFFVNSRATGNKEIVVLSVQLRFIELNNGISQSVERHDHASRWNVNPRTYHARIFMNFRIHAPFFGQITRHA